MSIKWQDIKKTDMVKIKLNDICELSYPCKHNIIITDKNGEIYKSHTNAFNLLPFYDLLSINDRNHIEIYLQDKSLSKQAFLSLLEYKNLQISELKKEIQELKNIIDYQPGGDGYEIAKKEFEKLSGQ